MREKERNVMEIRDEITKINKLVGEREKKNVDKIGEEILKKFSSVAIVCERC